MPPGAMSSKKLPDGCLRVVLRQARDWDAYIPFESAVVLPEHMPYGWRRKGDTLPAALR